MSVEILSLATRLYAIRDLLPRELNIFSAILLLVVSLALIFAGRHIVKGLAFIVVGLVVGAFGAIAGGMFLGLLGVLLGGLIGFILGGLLGLLLLSVGIGLALGLVAYNTAQALFHVYLLSVLVGVVFFVVGVVLYQRIVSLATAVVGALLFFDVALFFRVPWTLAAAAAIVLAALGYWVQGPTEQRKAATQTTAYSAPPSNQQTEGSKFCSKCGTKIPKSAQFCPSCGTGQGF